MEMTKTEAYEETTTEEVDAPTTPDDKTTAANFDNFTDTNITKYTYFFNNFDEKLSKIFKILWFYYLYNSIILICDKNLFNLSLCNVYTWFPYDSNTKCGTNFYNFIKIDECLVNMVNQTMTTNYMGKFNYIHNYYGKDVNYNVNNKIYIYNETMHNLMKDFYYVPIKTLNTAVYDAFLVNNKPPGIFEFKSRQHNTIKIINNNNLNERRLNENFTIHFFNKIPNDLTGCTFKSQLIIWPPFVTPTTTAWYGLEHKLFLDISRFMNFQLIHLYDDTRHNSTKAETESTPVGVVPTTTPQNIPYIFNQTQFEACEMIIGNIYPNIEVHEEFDHSIAYLYDHVNWVVPLAGKQPVWLNLTSAFSLTIWIIIVIAILLFTIIYDKIEKIHELTYNGIMNCIRISLATSIPILPEKTLTRIFFMVWCLYCLHLNIFFQSRLITLLTSPLTEKQITTPNELITSSISIGFSETFEVHLKRINTTESNYFIANNKKCTFSTCLEKMKQGPFATIGNRMYLQYSLAFIHKNVSFFILKEPMAKSFVEMLMRKGFPLRDRINNKIRIMIESGYLAMSQVRFKYYVGNVTIFKSKNESNSIEQLKMEHFLAAFMLLGFGLLFSLIIFFIEIRFGSRFSDFKLNTT